MNLGGWIIGAIVMGAWGFVMWLIFVREAQIKADELRIQQAQRDVLAVMGRGVHGRRDAA